MGRAAALLSPRAAAFAVLAAALAVYYSTAVDWPNVSKWWEVVVLAFGVLPAVFGLVYAVLPFWRAPAVQLAAVAAAFGLAAAAFQHEGLVKLAGFAKLGGAAALAFVFLAVFESASWVALIAALIPWVDAYSVFWGPTSKILEHPKGVSWLSFAFPVPGEHAIAALGLPDLLFFSLFLAAAARFRLRPSLTFVLMAASFGATMALAVWTNRSLPATPLLSVGFLVANADLLWREVRRRPPMPDSGGSPSERGPARAD